jgi:Na+-translocating ferredoxin:NAD+ oxidoreductase RnfD subunit
LRLLDRLLMLVHGVCLLLRSSIHVDVPLAHAVVAHCCARCCALVVHVHLITAVTGC